jgi:uncharacterized cofD-like protein
LVAELTDGTRIFGEKAIDVPRGTQREKIRDVFLVPHHNESISVYPPVIDAAWWADYIVIGPGDLFTSIIPGLIVPGVVEAFRKSRGRLLFVMNIMTKFGETHNFTGWDFVARLEEVFGREVDGVLYNSSRPDADILAQYRNQKSEFVEINPEEACWGKRRVFSGDILETSGGIVRHDPRKLAAMIQRIINENRPTASPNP